mmetsp:Transcript_26193/g.51284  ORF Transcript_26193/g.51284 Transcript_26193/m.51284 type:complete len:698 (-) Transcript_26193:38-2131(-)
MEPVRTHVMEPVRTQMSSVDVCHELPGTPSFVGGSAWTVKAASMSSMTSPVSSQTRRQSMHVLPLEPVNSTVRSRVGALEGKLGVHQPRPRDVLVPRRELKAQQSSVGGGGMVPMVQAASVDRRICDVSDEAPMKNTEAMQSLQSFVEKGFAELDSSLKGLTEALQAHGDRTERTESGFSDLQEKFEKEVQTKQAEAEHTIQQLAVFRKETVTICNDALNSAAAALIDKHASAPGGHELEELSKQVKNMQDELLDIRDALAANDEQCRALNASVKEDTGVGARLDAEMRKIHELVVAAAEQRDVRWAAEMREVRVRIDNAVHPREDPELRQIRARVDDAMKVFQENSTSERNKEIELKQLSESVEEAVRGLQQEKNTSEQNRETELKQLRESVEEAVRGLQQEKNTSEQNRETELKQVRESVEEAVRGLQKEKNTSEQNKETELKQLRECVEDAVRGHADISQHLRLLQQRIEGCEAAKKDFLDWCGCSLQGRKDICQGSPMSCKVDAGNDGLRGQINDCLDRLTMAEGRLGSLQEMMSAVQGETSIAPRIGEPVDVMREATPKIALQEEQIRALKSEAVLATRVSELVDTLKHVSPKVISQEEQISSLAMTVEGIRDDSSITPQVADLVDRLKDLSPKVIDLEGCINQLQDRVSSLEDKSRSNRAIKEEPQWQKSELEARLGRLERETERMSALVG